ncbi:hypothetical protein TNCV_2753941 [Trichonephila clavipes]|nr:hypothetical protein TNCV_2753941 [Trichonephila clavipes]
MRNDVKWELRQTRLNCSVICIIMTVDDSLFLGTWTDKQSSIPYHDVCDAGLDFVGFFSLRVTCRRFGCGDGIREEGLRDDYLELKFYTVLRA